ncbi:MAG TPA: hypothetical protein VF551_07090, partial [Chthoniobacterales bacterium]
TDAPSAAFAACWDAAQEQARAEERLISALDEELARARTALLDSSRTLLPPYLIFGVGGVRELLPKLLAPPAADEAPAARRSARSGDRERHLLLYLQRISAKNDTFSEFGPSAWSRFDAAVDGAEFRAEPGVSKRDTFLERWTSHAVAATLNRDEEIRPELKPQVNPNGCLERGIFILTDTNDRILLDPDTLALLQRCDGQTPAHALGVPLPVLQRLADRGLLRWQVDVPALDPHAFETLIADVSAWRETPARARCLALLEPIAELPTRFEAETDPLARIDIISAARERLGKLGAEHAVSQRSLYAAGNPIAEECFRNAQLTLNPEMAERFARDAEPWIDLWRDTYAFVASRVAAGLRRFVETAPSDRGAVPLPAFLRHCANNQMPLTSHGLVVLAHRAFDEVKAAFREKFRDRPDAPEWELTPADCRFVRERFEFPAFDEYTYPSADLQISARSIDAVQRGEYQWVISELHPAVALLHHCFFWSCPDKPALSAALASTTHGQPNFHFGFGAADFTAHTTVRVFDALPDLTNFVAAERGHAEWKTVAPSEAEVFVDETSGDVALRKRDSGEYLGSFARAWVIPLGFHPFYFGRAPHMPRLRCGDVVVQRRSWTVKAEELRHGDFTGVSRQLVLAMEQLRAEKGWPRFIYIRPTEQALRRSGAEGRDKDTKPVFIDLESYLSLEILQRWLAKSGELEVTEMLPDPDHLCWHEADGRRTFELRTLIVPRS